MADLEAALCVRGRTRKRFLSECHDHLIDLANDVGPDDAAVAFGAPGIVAASFDAEVATSRCARAAWLAAVGIASVAGSTLVLIHSADATAQAAVPWAIAFFVCAQVSAVAMVIGLIQAMSIRHRVVPPADSMLLCRRTAIALVSAAGTMLAAGGALQGAAILSYCLPVRRSRSLPVAFCRARGGSLDSSRAHIPTPTALRSRICGH